MHYKLILAGGITILSLAAFLSNKLTTAKGQLQKVTSIYDLKLKGLGGGEVDFSQYRGAKLLIVNTASKCGKTPQYADLEKLHEQYGEKVKVLGFPANNFLWQEPGTNEEIADFCQKNYGVTFQMFEKLSVKGGDQHPLYAWLEQKTGEHPDWNFSKYLVNEDGTQVSFYKSSVKVTEPVILDKILK
jgi:glutathione peroxidase